MDKQSAQLEGHSLILYDGLCGMCDRFVQFVLPRDRDGVFLFTPLQSTLATELLAQHGISAADLDMVCIVTDVGTASERVFVRSSAVVKVMRALGKKWRFLGSLLWLIPSPLRDVGYRAVANVRYRIFGKHDSCPLPRPEDRARFLSMDTLSDHAS